MNWVAIGLLIFLSAFISGLISSREYSDSKAFLLGSFSMLCVVLVVFTGLYLYQKVNDGVFLLSNLVILGGIAVSVITGIRSVYPGLK